MNKDEKIKAFDPNGVASSEQLFGLPFSEAESETIVYPVPWEVTVSYSAGTAAGPAAVREASLQVDLYDPLLPNAWKRGIYMVEEDRELRHRSEHFRGMAEDHISKLEEGEVGDLDKLATVNQACADMVARVKSDTAALLDEGKRVVLLGGDHSTPLGFVQALAERHQDFAVLQIDAHADLREAYEGFEYSHASIMTNVLKLPQVKRLVQVGIRDYCEAELEVIESSKGRISTYFDRDLKAGQYRGQSWEKQCEKIIGELPAKVYLSFDIDGLDPKLCPNTGTPVAGGFEVEEVLFLLEMLVAKGHSIIGIDLNEVVPGEGDWDANVAARLLYRLCNLMALSRAE